MDMMVQLEGAPGGGAGAPRPRRGPTGPYLESFIQRMNVPMFAVRVLSRDPLDVAFSASNDALNAVAGVAPGALVGRRPTEALPPRVAAAVLENYRTCLDGGEAITYEEAFEGLHGERWFQTTLSPWIGATGQVEAIVGTPVDITAWKARAAGDARRISQLTRLNDEVRTFASMAAHDVRGPLGTIESLTDLIADGLGAVDDTKRALVDACGDTARSARGQMDELLRHAAALTVEETPASEFDLDRVCSDIASLIDPEGRIEIDWPEACIEADGVALQLILRNLMSNAVRFCRARVSVALDLPCGPGALGAFTVADDGPGFPEGVDPFVGDTTLARHRTARGFGLQAARYLVEARGGTIGVMREVEGGAVRFTLPVRRLAPEVCEAMDQPASEGPGDGAGAAAQGG